MAIETFSVGYGRKATIDGVHRLNIADAGDRLDFSFAGLQRDLRRLGLQPSEVGVDILTIGLAVYFADVSAVRAQTGDDGWTRHLDLQVEVQTPGLWEKLAEPLVRGLRFVSSDKWRVRFDQRAMDIEGLGFSESESQKFETDRIALLSGGLDSAIHAINALEDRKPLLTSSISTADTRSTGGPQNRILQKLTDCYGETFAGIRLVVRLPRSEASQRARSFLFLSFASFLASCYEHHIKLIIPENGLIAINVPLNANRMASNSTKTAHPFFLYRFQEVLDGCAIGVTMENPYCFKTKGEMIGECANRDLLDKILPLTVSCAKPPLREGTPDMHCGCCPACLIRRASILAGYHDNDPTAYHTVPRLYEHVLDSSKKEGRDVQAFKAAAERLAKHPDYAAIDIYRAGPLSDVRNNLDEYASVYQRGMAELHNLLAAVRTKG